MILCFFASMRNLYVKYSELVENIGQRIKLERQKKQLTQLDLAAKYNIERANLARIEAGKTNPIIKSLFSITEALEIDIKELF